MIPRSAKARECLEALRGGGFEIGLHAGYRTLGDSGRLAEEKGRLAGILGHGRFGGRQHYLRFRVPDTWRDWESVGLTYDSTLTFFDHEGFRCGTCHPYRPFDLERNRELGLWEIPLIVMDGTLRDYRRLSPAAAATHALALAKRCEAVGGTFALLWHNSSLEGSWRAWSEVYEGLVAWLADHAGGLGSSSGFDPGAAGGLR